MCTFLNNACNFRGHFGKILCTFLAIFFLHMLCTILCKFGKCYAILRWNWAQMLCTLCAILANDIHLTGILSILIFRVKIHSLMVGANELTTLLFHSSVASHFDVNFIFQICTDSYFLILYFKIWLIPPIWQFWNYFSGVLPFVLLFKNIHL